MQSDREATLQGGMTLVEAMIVIVISAVVLGAIYGSATSVSKISQMNNREVKSRARQSDILERVQSELEQTGATGHYTILAGGKSIVYSKLIGAQQVGSDVSGIWSHDYTIERTTAGIVRRKYASMSESWGSGVLDLSFVKNPLSESIKVTCVTRQKGKDVARSVDIYPQH